MRENFKPALKFTLRYEGGFVNHPKDPGGATNKGITLATFRRYRPGATVAQLKAIDDATVERIYRDGYWQEARCDDLSAGVDGATFDYAVNSGPGAARKALNAVVGGPAADTVKKLCARRLAVYRTFRHWKTFGKGWTARITAGEALWVRWALAKAQEPAVVAEKLEEESAAARKKATAQKNGAGGAAAGSGGAVAADQMTTGATQADQIAGWLLAGGVVLVVAVVGWLAWRAWINGQRAKAYAAESEAAISEVKA